MTVTVRWVNVGCRRETTNYKETKKKADCKNGASNMDKVVEFSTNLLRSVNSGYVLYPRVFVCLASYSLSRRIHLLVNHSWSCVVVL